MISSLTSGVFVLQFSPGCQHKSREIKPISPDTEETGDAVTRLYSIHSLGQKTENISVIVYSVSSFMIQKYKV